MTKRPVSPPTPAPSPLPICGPLAPQSGPQWSNTPFQGASGQESNSFLNLTQNKRFILHGSNYGTNAANSGSVNCQHSLNPEKTIQELFVGLNSKEKLEVLTNILDGCSKQQMSYVSSYIAPKLKKDFLRLLPTELALRILSNIDDPKTLARASQVSRHWHRLLNDDFTWKVLCTKHRYRRLSWAQSAQNKIGPTVADAEKRNLHLPNDIRRNGSNTSADVKMEDSSAAFNQNLNEGRLTNSVEASIIPSSTEIDPINSQQCSCESSSSAESTLSLNGQLASYKSRFRHKYLVETAWRSGGRHIAGYLTSDLNPVVTVLHLTDEYIIAGLDNSNIYLFGLDGRFVRTLTGHESGVWALCPYLEILVSGGCDRFVRVWNMHSGECRHILPGHTSTVRCIKVVDRYTAVSGSRDATLRVWNIEHGYCIRTLTGHVDSVRCLQVRGDICVSGSYDATAKIWDIAHGTCLQTLHGHLGQIYDIAFNGEIIVTGGLDFTIRVWGIDGQLIKVLQGHTSLVGQLQLDYPMLVSGGSDGSVRVWNLERLECVQRIAAHDNSVTSIQFDDKRIMSGGRDGSVKVWDLQSGCLIRELIEPAEEVWRVAFNEELAVVAASRNSRISIEIISFAPENEKRYSTYNLKFIE